MANASTALPAAPVAGNDDNSTLARLRGAYEVALFRLAHGYGDLEDCLEIQQRIAAEEAAVEELVNFRLFPEVA